MHAISGAQGAQPAVFRELSSADGKLMKMFGGFAGFLIVLGLALWIGGSATKDFTMRGWGIAFTTFGVLGVIFGSCCCCESTKPFVMQTTQAASRMYHDAIKHVS